MSEGTDTRPTAAGAKPKVPEHERRKLPPVPKGWVRGRVVELAARSERTALGERSTHVITIQPAKPAPALVVELSGLTITRRVRQGEVVQVFRGDATEQPLRVERIGLPINGGWIEAYNAAPITGRRRWFERIGGVLMVVTPIALVGGALLLLRYYWHVLG